MFGVLYFTKIPDCVKIWTRKTLFNCRTKVRVELKHLLHKVQTFLRDSLECLVKIHEIFLFEFLHVGPGVLIRYETQIYLVRYPDQVKHRLKHVTICLGKAIFLDSNILWTYRETLAAMKNL